MICHKSFRKASQNKQQDEMADILKDKMDRRKAINVRKENCLETVIESECVICSSLTKKQVFIV